MKQRALIQIAVLMSLAVAGADKRFVWGDGRALIGTVTIEAACLAGIDKWMDL